MAFRHLKSHATGLGKLQNISSKICSGKSGSAGFILPEIQLGKSCFIVALKVGGKIFIAIQLVQNRIYYR